MKAVVMAGGEGTRLRPLTSNQPKPMVPIVGKPCMEHILELLRRYGFTDVVVTVAFLPQAIRSYFGDGDSLGMSIEYSVEESPLGTAGSVRLASGVLDDTFLGVFHGEPEDRELTLPTGCGALWTRVMDTERGVATETEEYAAGAPISVLGRTVWVLKRL